MFRFLSFLYTACVPPCGERPGALHTGTWMHTAAGGAAVMLALWCSCAHKKPPQGGPPDTTGPRIIRTEPANGQSDVALDTRLTFHFSEWIAPERARTSVLVYPPLASRDAIRVRGPRLIIDPRDGFRDSMTYHITITTSCRDLHGNDMGRPYSFIFSTGAELDSGHIDGCVAMAPGTPVRGTSIKVALYEFKPGEAPERLLYRTPRFVTETDSAARFAFDFIPRRSYAVVGFIDRNNDNTLQYAAEEVYTGTRLQLRPDTSVVLYPSQGDTARYRVSSVEALSSDIYVITWDRPPAARYVPLYRRLCRIRPPDALQGPTCIDTIRVMARSSRWLVHCSTGLQRGRHAFVYPAIAPYGPLGTDTAAAHDSRAGKQEAQYAAQDTAISGYPAAHADMVHYDSLLFNTPAAPDTLPPAFVKDTFLLHTGIHPRLALAYTEPAKMRDSVPLVCIDSAHTDSVWAQAAEGFSDTCTITPLQALTPGGVYTLVIRGQRLTDAAGNHGRDTAVVLVRTHAADSLCLSLAGSSPCPDPDGTRRWRFVYHRHRPHTPVITTQHNARFLFDTLAAGHGHLYTWLDRTSDGRYTAGRLFPWRAPEPFVSFRDTVEARARWDISGITLPHCRPCRFKGMEPPGTAQPRSGTAAHLGGARTENVHRAHSAVDEMHTHRDRGVK